MEILKSYQVYALKHYGNTIVSKKYQIEDVISECATYGVNVRVRDFRTIVEDFDPDDFHIIEDIERFSHVEE